MDEPSIIVEGSEVRKRRRVFTSLKTQSWREVATLLVISFPLYLLPSHCFISPSLHPQMDGGAEKKREVEGGGGGGAEGIKLQTQGGGEKEKEKE